MAEEEERLRNEEMEKLKEFQKRFDADNKRKEDEKKVNTRRKRKN